MRLLLTLLFLALQCSLALAQTDGEEWSLLMQDIVDDVADVDDDEATLEALIDELNDLHEHPLDLNAVTPEQLRRLPFLTEVQIRELLDYIARHGPLRSVGELLLTRSIGLQQVRWLRATAYVDEENVALAEQQRRGSAAWKSEFCTRLDIPLYQRDGWPWARGLAHRWRYVGKSQHVEVGIRGEKDAGEQMFTRKTPLWDAMGLYACLRDVGPLRMAVIGDYKVSFGEGIVINQGFGFGRHTTAMWRNSQTIRPHRATDEVAFMRGGAAVLDLGRGFDLTAFVSARRLDATLSGDTAVKSLSTTGYHRTASELARRNNLWSHTAGTHVQWQHAFFAVGASAVYQHYALPFVRGKALYRQIYPEGSHFGNVGVDYRLSYGHLGISGETARSFSEAGGGWATLNRAVYRFTPNTRVLLLQRFYSYRYLAHHAHAFGDNQRVQNESGVCVQADADRVGPFALSALMDVFYSPWPRYTMTHSSRGWEAMATATLFPQGRHQLTMRYRLRSKERSDRRGLNHSLRASYVYAMAAPWKLRLDGFVHRYHTPVSTSNGYALSPRVDYKGSGRLKGSVAAVLFNADDNDSRITLYEPTLSQTFGLQQLYGRGQRWVTTLAWSVTRNIAFQAKGGVTHYDNRSTISSGITRIRSHWKSDVQLFLKIKI